MLNISDLRKEYLLKTLDLNDLNPNPFLQFKIWFSEAQQAQVLEPHAMALATANKEGHPSCRMVLLKKMDLTSFLFFSNYNSRKGHELNEVPFACVTFFGKNLKGK